MRVEANIRETADASATLTTSVLDPDLVERVLDPRASDRDREAAVIELGVPPASVCSVFASSDGHLQIVHPTTVPSAPPLAGRVQAARGGVGPAVLPVDLAHTVEIARMAACFAADGTPADPGSRVVHSEQLGALILLAQATARHSVPDVDGLEEAAASAPWMLPTLEALLTHESMRATAQSLLVHHSTLQERIVLAERRLGWPIRDTEGRYRLLAALMVRRMCRNAARWGAYQAR